ncbi:MAG: large subunit ribosomal protein L9 [Saprospiraceae bacterium]|jgi:large subunit ribosomal protein L9
MEVILLERIQNLGDLGELVNVKPGYGRNYLVPQQKAVFASEDAKEKVEEARRRLAEEESKRIEVAQAKAELAVREVTITRLANAEGHLFGSVANTDVAEAMTEAGQAIEKSEVYLVDGPFKEVGVYAAEIILHADVRFDMVINVEGEEGEMPEGFESAAEATAEDEAKLQAEREIQQFENSDRAEVEAPTEEA